MKEVKTVKTPLYWNVLIEKKKKIVYVTLTVNKTPEHRCCWNFPQGT